MTSQDQQTVPPSGSSKAEGTRAATVALIAGGAGDLGEGIVRAFLAEGAIVVVPSRSLAKLDALRAAMPPDSRERLHTIVAEMATQRGAIEVRDDLLSRFGRLDDVVASLGSWWQGAAVVDISAEIWSRLIEGNFVAHLTVAQTFLPHLSASKRGSYLLINGGSALQPVPKAGPMSILGAAQTMLARVLISEHKDSGVRVNQLMLQSPVQTRARRTLQPDWITADEVGRVATWLASDAGAMVNGSIMPLGDRPPPERA